jgi:hypothetical protein
MEIITYTEAPAGSKHIAEIEVYYKRIFYRRIRIMLSQKGHYFLNLPVYGEDDGKGGKKWIQFWEWTKDEDVEFKRECMEALGPYLNKGTHRMPEGRTYTTSSQAQKQPSAAPFQPDLGECPF